MFQIIGAMAEFERALTVERVKAGIDNARRKGRQLGRPRHEVDLVRVAKLRQMNRSWREVGRELNLDPMIAYRAFSRSNNPAGDGSVSSFGFSGTTDRFCRSK